MKEIGLQRIWEKQAFQPKHLKTTSGKDLHILHPGDWNDQNGPDFLNASIRIDDLQLHGAIEIHLKAGDWFAHKHHTDPRFNQTILHVVWENNKPCFLENGQSLECLSLQNRIYTQQIIDHDAGPELPCKALLHLSDDTIKSQQLQLALKKRFNLKTQQILQKHQELHQDWWYTALWCLLTAWMGKANQNAVNVLLQNLHKQWLMRNRNPTIMLAYLFGRAGWLNEIQQQNDIEATSIEAKRSNGNDPYTHELIEEYAYLTLKHEWGELDRINWNTKQVRPASFPQIRMAQFSDLLHRNNADLSEIFSAQSADLKQWIQFFTADANDYWKIHYTLNKPSAIHNSSNGSEHAKKVILNGLIPFLYAFGLETNKPQLIQIAEELLTQLPAENNNITRSMEILNIPNKSASISQSLIAQNKHFCSVKSCKECKIGNDILNLPFMTHEA